MSQSNKKILNALFRIPWWVSVGLACCVYVGLKYIIPSIETENAFLAGLGKTGPYFAPFAALVFLLPAPFSLFAQKEEKSLEDLMETLQDIESLRALSQQDFEYLIELIYSSGGFTVLKNTLEGVAGKAVFRFDKDGEYFIALCSQAPGFDEGTGAVSELCDIVMAEQAHGGIIITAGIFTRETVTFAEDKPIDLVDGKQLLTMLDSLRKDTQYADKPGKT